MIQTSIKSKTQKRKIKSKCIELDLDRDRAVTVILIENGIVKKRERVLVRSKE